MELKGDLVLACVVGETQGGEGTNFLMESGLRTAMAVSPEPTGVGNIATVHAGIAHLAIHTYGVTGHISVQEHTINAVSKMTKIIDALESMKFTHTPSAKLPAMPRINVGSIIGGRGERLRTDRASLRPRPLHHSHRRPLRSRPDPGHDNCRHPQRPRSPGSTGLGTEIRDRSAASRFFRGAGAGS